jgi:hypothetical protein
MAGDAEMLLLARRAGARHARHAMFFGLLSAAGIMVLMLGAAGLADMVGDAPAQAFICLTFGPWVAHQLGSRAGPLVLLQGWNAFIVSLCVGVLSVGTTTFAFSLVSFFQEGWPGAGSFMDAAQDYLGKPFFWVFFMGGIPIVLASVGMALAFRRERRSSFSGPREHR